MILGTANNYVCHTSENVMLKRQFQYEDNLKLLAKTNEECYQCQNEQPYLPQLVSCLLCASYC